MHALQVPEIGEVPIIVEVMDIGFEVKLAYESMRRERLKRALIFYVSSRRTADTANF